MPSTPRSQPWMTPPEPSWKVNGSPRSHEASNWRPLTNEMPTYWTVTSLPASAVAPVPSSMSLITSSLGALPLGTVISGLVFAGVEVASGLDEEVSSESEPQPATASAAQARTTRSSLASGMAPEGSGARSAVGAEDAVARIAQARADVAVGVELAVERGGDDLNLVVGAAQRLDPLGRRHEADERDPLGPRPLEPRDRLRRAAARGEHRVDDEHLGVLDPRRDVLVVADGPQRLLVAVHAEVADAGLRHQPQEAVDEPEPGAQDRHDHDLVGEPHAGGRLEQGLDLDLVGPQ